MQLKLQHPRRYYPEFDERYEGRQYQYLIGYRVHQLPEIGDLVVAFRQEPVQEVR